MIFTNILQGKKYGIVQTVSPLSHDFLFLTTQLNCSDRNFPKNSMWKVALVSQNVQNLKNSPEMQENSLLTLLFLAMLTSYNVRKILRFQVSVHYYYSSHHQRTSGHKSIGSHLKHKQSS